ncbi:MAG TPA: prolyl aminopeptidase [Devosia sp.]|nr:prolyl aminopeptidase [Devosia sp.]
MDTASATSTRRGVFPAIEPFATHRLRVSPVHELHIAEYGNPKGKPAVVLHGGPGGKSTPKMAQHHHPEHYRIILFDQRGCGLSTPHAELTDNTTWHLVADLEAIRQHLGIETWQVTGGSWGSTLALAYSESHPERVTELIVRGIFMSRRSEVNWFYQEGASHLFPEAFEAFQEFIPDAERSDMIAAYHRRLTGPDVATRHAAARAWSLWEGTTISLLPDPEREKEFVDPDFALALARIECHYFLNEGFFTPRDWILANAGKLASIPGVIIHGRYDVCTPMSSAWQLHKAWPNATFVVVPDGGHTHTEPGILHELVTATESFR